MGIRLKVAKESELTQIYKAFSSRPDLFPHIRKNYIADQIEKGSVVHAKGVYIIFDKYKRKQQLGTATAFKGNYILHQIVNTTQGNGIASQVFDAWLKLIDNNIYLTVRSANLEAIRFYKHKGMERVGDIDWSGGNLKGSVYRLIRGDGTTSLF